MKGGLGNIMKQAQAMQENMKKAQDVVDALLVGEIALIKIEEAARANMSLDECLCADLRSRNRIRRVGGGR